MICEQLIVSTQEEDTAWSPGGDSVSTESCAQLASCVQCAVLLPSPALDTSRAVMCGQQQQDIMLLCSYHTQALTEILERDNQIASDNTDPLSPRAGTSYAAKLLIGSLPIITPLSYRQLSSDIKHSISNLIGALMFKT